MTTSNGYDGNSMAEVSGSHGRTGSVADSRRILESDSIESFKGREVLEQVWRLLDKKARFGTRGTKFTRPFSRQFKKEVRDMFPAEESFHDHADKIQNKVILTYAVLRFSTLLLFIVFLYIVNEYYIWYIYHRSMIPSFVEYFGQIFTMYNNSLSSLSIDVRFLSPLLFVTALSIVFLIIRYFVRLAFFQQLGISARALQFEAFNRRAFLGARVLESCGYITERPVTGAWPIHAKYWAQISIWYGMRDEYLDRYSTTILWIIQHYIDTMEKISWILKVVIIFFSTYLVLTSYQIFSLQSLEREHNIEAISVALTILIISVLGWIVAFRKPADFWGQIFIPGELENGQHREIYVGVISRKIEELIDRVDRLETGRGRGSV